MNIKIIDEKFYAFMIVFLENNVLMSESKK